jgi:hypothetical protein
MLVPEHDPEQSKPRHRPVGRHSRLSTTRLPFGLFFGFPIGLLAEVTPNRFN